MSFQSNTALLLSGAEGAMELTTNQMGIKVVFYRDNNSKNRKEKSTTIINRTKILFYNVVNVSAIN